MRAELSPLVSLLTDKRSILVFTGAGISTESGIPDFRGPSGVWTKVDPAEFTYQRYVTSAETRRRSWQMRSESGILDALPNDAHRAVEQLWRAGIVAGCVTQNIDGLHQAAGMPDSAVVELHGNAHTTRCLDCAARWPTTEIEARVQGGDDDPHCGRCGGILKTTVVSFGEEMPRAEVDRAFALAATADAVLAVGSTLSVYPAAEVPLEAAQRGVPYIIVNLGPTDHDQVADIKVEQPAGLVLPPLAEALAGAPS